MDVEKKIKEAKDVLTNGGNVIKTRDDRDLCLVDSEGTILNKRELDWGLSKEDKASSSVFRKRIEPWLTSLFQSEHLSLLCGSGITNAIS